MEHVFEAMVDVVLVVDLLGQITLSNPAARRVTGYTHEELSRIPLVKLLGDEQSELRTAVRQRVVEGAVLRREDSWLNAKHERIPVSVTAAPVVDEHAVPTAIVLVLRDISELQSLLHDRDRELARRTAAEEQLRTTMATIEHRLAESRAHLLLAERRATLGTLAGGIGHELRNMAQIQLGALLTLDDELPQSGRSGAAVLALADLQRVCEHITTHARWLMQFAKPGPDHARPLDVGRAIRDVITMLHGAGKLRSAEVAFADPGPVLVTVNKTRIEQILVNLLVNAADAIGDASGRIDIAVRRDNDARRVIVEVSDTGAGIAADVLPRIFEPFFTTKGEDNGTGLGLPVVREIVESYGGSLRVDSVVGRGATFGFDLPMSAEALYPGGSRR